MNSRLQQFLDLEQLTPSRFADILGVQRSGLSHILSGRNKPGYDFMFKLTQKFPQINIEWLLTGKGKPYKDMNHPTEKVHQPKESGTLFSGSLFQHEEEFDNSTENKSFNSKIETLKVDEILKNQSDPVIPHKNRNVKRITLFFSDGSFEEFFPG